MTDFTLPLTGQVLMSVPDIDSTSSADRDPATNYIPTDDLEAATVITSLVEGSPFGFHKPVLDIDFPAKLVPSSTPGHFHLFLDKEVPESTYFGLLDALARAGIIEDGYVGASRSRGFTAARLPWVKKPVPEPVSVPE